MLSNTQDLLLYVNGIVALIYSKSPTIIPEHILLLKRKMLKRASITGIMDKKEQCKHSFFIYTECKKKFKFRPCGDFMMLLTRFTTVTGVKSIQFYLKQMSMNLARFYYIGCCTFCGSSEMKCPLSIEYWVHLIFYCVWKWCTTYTKPYPFIAGVNKRKLW